jgi:hypothetical protein
MAGGHVNRVNRPNTWLHRPAIRRKDFPCQLGAVHTWRITEMLPAAINGRLRFQSGLWRPVQRDRHLGIPAACIPKHLGYAKI